jgi:hypothetical protein
MGRSDAPFQLDRFVQAKGTFVEFPVPRGVGPDRGSTVLFAGVCFAEFAGFAYAARERRFCRFWQLDHGGLLIRRFSQGGPCIVAKEISIQCGRLRAGSLQPLVGADFTVLTTLANPF